jgi:predicted esterase
MISIFSLLLLLATASDFDVLWRSYHSAGDPLSREVAWAELKLHGWPNDFDATLERLRSREYSPEVPTGLLRESRSDLEERRYKYMLLVPENYDPSHSYPVQVVLHGSTRRKAWKDGEDPWRWIDPFRSESIITVFPAAWEDAMWWSDRQVENLRQILDGLRARYHIDSNRCYLTGVSDGGTGTFYHALHAPTPWAAYLPLIGHPWVLGNRREGADGSMFASNLHGRWLLAVNGTDDQLYPAKALIPYLDLFRRAGAHVESKEKPGGHSVRWWPEEAANFATFRHEHPRDPFPDALVWETDDPARGGRSFWAIIHEIGEDAAPDPDPLNTVLFPDLEPPTRAEAFPRSRASGRLRLKREGNTIQAETRNVLRFELLLGVDELEFDLPLKLVVNGVQSTHELSRDLDTLVRWAIVDGDSELLVAASIMVDVP